MTEERVIAALLGIGICFFVGRFVLGPVVIILAEAFWGVREWWRRRVRR